MLILLRRDMDLWDHCDDSRVPYDEAISLRLRGSVEIKSVPEF